MGSRHICVFGDANIDLSYVVKKLPSSGRESIASTRRMSLGGSAVNTAISVQELGHTAKVLATVGADTWGNQIRDRLQSVGLETDFLYQTPDESSQLNVVMVDANGERSMVSFRGASALTSVAQVREQWLAQADWLHISGYSFLESPQREAAIRAIDLANVRNIHISIDVPTVVSDVARKTLARLVPMLEIIVCNKEELHQLTGLEDEGTASRMLIENGLSCLAIKMGSRGASLIDAAGKHKLAVSSPQSVDSTGAGDAFCAGLISARLHHLSPMASLLLSCGLGAAATTQIGAGESLQGVRSRLVHILRFIDNSGPTMEAFDELVQTYGLAC